MSPHEFGIIVVGALAGWWLVSWLVDKWRASKQKKDMSEDQS
jgi:hypothetical protein